MGTNKYLISNIGCDDRTYLIAEFTDVEAEFLKNLFDRINKNSSYGCQPTIYIKKIKVIFEKKLEEYNDWYDYGYVAIYGDYDIKIDDTYYKYEEIE